MKKVRVQFLLFVYSQTKNNYRMFFRKKKRNWQFDEEQLLHFEEGTLGKKLGEFYKKYGFSMIDQRANHDVHHLITDCGTNFEDEIAMQFLLLGNGKMNAHLLAAIVLGSIILPEYFKMYREAFKKGKNMKPFHHWDFEELLAQNFENLRDFIQQKEVPVHY